MLFIHVDISHMWLRLYNHPLIVVRSLGPTPATLIIISSIHPTDLMTLYNSYNTTTAPYIFVFSFNIKKKNKQNFRLKHVEEVL